MFDNELVFRAVFRQIVNSIPQFLTLILPLLLPKSPFFFIEPRLISYDSNVPLPFLSILLRALVEQLLVHFHKQFESVVDQAVDSFVPMTFRVFVQTGKHDR